MTGGPPFGSAPPPISRAGLAGWTGDLRQLASVRGITLSDGPERGLRALAFSTGGGLDFWALADRCLDIGPLWVGGLPVAWQHPNGFIAPDLFRPEADRGTGFQRALSGLLVTCGLDHVRQPTRDQPLHGTVPLTPARLLARGEEWDAPEPVLYAEAEVTQAHLGGAAFRLRRRIEAPVGGRSLTLSDRVENIGVEPQALNLLYHINFGFPAVGVGTEVLLDGVPQMRVPLPCDEAAASVQCLRVPGHELRAELRRPAEGSWPGLRASVTADARDLPFVQFWSDPRPRRNILAIEPATCERRPDGTSEPGPTLRPGEDWTARLALDFATAGG